MISIFPSAIIREISGKKFIPKMAQITADVFFVSQIIFIDRNIYRYALHLRKSA